MKSSPIYNIISNPDRKSDCSFGAKEGFIQDIKVGTSKSNSHTLAKITVEKYIDAADNSVHFRMWLDGSMIRHGVLRGTDFNFE